MAGKLLALRVAVVLALLPAATGAQEIAQGGPRPEPTDRASEQIDLIHPSVVATARALGRDVSAAPARSQYLNFPLRLKPAGRGASPFGISNFVDLDASAGLLDWNCGNRTYDGHRGNDIYLPIFPWYVMDRAEVDIVAAASGTIVVSADGNFDRQCIDINNSNSNPPLNYVGIHQDDGFFAYYFHMKKDSVTTKTVGSRIERGEKIGNVGSSGFSSGPHLHFELRDAGSNPSNTIDAFAGACGASSTLWRHQWNAQQDTRLIQVASISGPPVFPACGTDETPHYTDTFSPGQTVYRMVIVRDQRPGDAIKIDLLRPDGSQAATCNSGSPPPAGFYSSAYWYCTYALPGNAPSGTWRIRATLGTQVMEHSFFVTTAPAQATILSSVLPTGRSVQSSQPATIFASIINAGTIAAEGCWIQPETPLAAGFTFQTTNPATNQLTGTANTNVSIPAGGSQSFLIALQPEAGKQAAAVTVGFRFKCTNADAAPYFDGVNTMLLSFDPNPVPDIIPVGTTPTNDSVVHIPGNAGTGVLATAAVNIGASANLTAMPVGTPATLPLTLTICETNSSTGACLAPAAANVSHNFTPNQPATFTVFAKGNGAIAFDPANSRIRLDFVDAGGIVRGQTGAAVKTD